MNTTIGILAHVDAGKTTFSEQLLYHAGGIRTRGRVDYQDTFLDCHQIERDRGITVFSEQGVFSYGENSYTLLDTPGHVDFSAEMERAIQVMDYAVVIISAVEGVQGHTETVFQLLEQMSIPVFLFINKTDREGADVKRVMKEIQSRLSSQAIFFGVGMSPNESSEQWIEEVAQIDETLLEYYLEQGYNEKYFNDKIIQYVKNRTMFPCFCGSALLDQGVMEFLEAMNTLVQTDYQNDADFCAQAFKIRHDNKGNRLAFLKILAGTLKTKETVSCFDEEQHQIATRKINEIRIYNGDKYQSVSQVRAGQICAVTGLDIVGCGDKIGAELGKANYRLVPMLSARVNFDKAQIAPKIMLGHLRMLEDEDPMLRTLWSEALQEIQIQIMGSVQLGVLTQVVKERFDVDITFGDCNLLYLETIADTVIGRGHFEPLKHYAEVHLRLEPNERGAGVTFSSECSLDVLDSNCQNLVQTHVFEREHRGILLGAPLTDVHITLLNGQAHNKHTEGGDFREATYRAIRQGLEKAQSCILEPYYRFVMETESELLGRLISDIQKYSGTFESPQIENGRVRIIGRAPAAKFMNYGHEFVTFTKGKGSLSLQFDGYERCEDTEEIIEQVGYDKNRDVEYTADSVFCSHGSGFTVKWQEADAWMHCK